MRRRGWTLHEMLVSLAVTGAIVALVAHTAIGQLRFFAAVGDLVALRGQINHASAIAASALWGVSSAGGDIVVAQDSAIEFHVPIGTSFVCASTTGQVTIPASLSLPGNTLSAFAELPDSGDRVMALFADSVGLTWLTLHAAGPPAPGHGCMAFSGVSATWNLPLSQPLLVPVGAPLRFTRPFRFSLYRASDARWYLGAKSWNASLHRFNGIQPVAGPLRQYDADPSRTGFLLTYRDEHGTVLDDPVETSRIASVTVIARAQAVRPRRSVAFGAASTHELADSSLVTIALRNAR